MSHKKSSTFTFTVALADAGQLSYLFYCKLQKESVGKLELKLPTLRNYVAILSCEK